MIQCRRTSRHNKEKLHEIYGDENLKFDVVIGNPPYQDESVGDSTQAPPIYHKFMDEAYKVTTNDTCKYSGKFASSDTANPP